MYVPHWLVQFHSSLGQFVHNGQVEGLDFIPNQGGALLSNTAGRPIIALHVKHSARFAESESLTEPPLTAGPPSGGPPLEGRVRLRTRPSLHARSTCATPLRWCDAHTIAGSRQPRRGMHTVEPLPRFL